MKLTGTQLILLSGASQREDHGVVIPPNLKGGAAQKVVAKLLEARLLEEIRAKGTLPVWRRDGENVAFALRITRPGLKTIAAEEGTPTETAGPGSAAKPAKVRGAKAGDKKTPPARDHQASPRKASVAGAPRAGSKIERVSL